MYESIFTILKYAYFSVILIAGAVAFFSRHLQPYSLRFVGLYIWGLVLIEFIVQLALYKSNIRGNFHLIIYEIFGFFEYLLIATTFCHYYSNFEANIVKITIFVYGLLTCISLVFLRDYLVFNYMFIIRCLLFIYLSLLYFYSVYKSEAILEIKHNPFFWISVGFFIFSAGSIFIKGLGYEIQKTNRNLAYSLYVLNSMLNIYLYVMILIGLLCYRKNITSY